jgi:hypothetical protein
MQLCVFLALSAIFRDGGSDVRGTRQRLTNR